MKNEKVADGEDEEYAEEENDENDGIMLNRFNEFLIFRFRSDLRRLLQKDVQRAREHIQR